MSGMVDLNPGSVSRRLPRGQANDVCVGVCVLGAPGPCGRRNKCLITQGVEQSSGLCLILLVSPETYLTYNDMFLALPCIFVVNLLCRATLFYFLFYILHTYVHWSTQSTRGVLNF